ncbi:MAG: hypothetical protein FJ095_14340 [Deltaproteobacteria bacterium]|nr:hypothetical protein [Deltaproteobacteria bacterium]
MSTSGPGTFDPRGVIRLDLRLGQLRLDSSHARVMVPAQALMALCSVAGEEQVVGLGHAIGESMGARIKERFASSAERAGSTDAVREAPFAVVVEHLAGELALGGLGALVAERWGKVVTLVVDHCPVAHEPIGDVLLCGVLSAALRTSCGRGASVVPLTREGSRTRFVVLGDEAVDGVLAALDAGVGWGDLLVRMKEASA